MGGTVTGEHGVGLGKVALLEEQFGQDGVGVMRNIKMALDPRFVKSLGAAIFKILIKIFQNLISRQILNPGKVIKAAAHT